MPKTLNQDHADTARKAIAACGFDPDQDLETSFKIYSSISPTSETPRASTSSKSPRASIRHWQVERIDPASVAEGPVVEIYIGKEGLPSPPKPKKRPNKRKKSRPA